MNLDAIQQHARSIDDTLKLLAEMEGRSDDDALQKRKQLHAYIVKLTRSIQQLVDEERQTL